MPCIQWHDDNLKLDQEDCFAHSMEYDIETNQVRPLTVKTDPWCSCGGLTPDGTLVVAGGFADGGKTSRYYGGQLDCQDCDWREYPDKLKEPRWYATQAILTNGEYIVIGGRRSFSYEFFPKEGNLTSDIEENNLYPFVHLSSSSPTTVPSSSTLTPTKLSAPSPSSPAVPGTTRLPASEIQKVFVPAIKDCSRMVITDPNPQSDSEEMPSGRTMGDSLILPTGQILFINGAQKGTAAW
ncbi:hypothetical protein JHK82_025612 [Glycine max]|nr:hypothetical protein JHK85_026230 [Glycine max]KAG5013477.1 hypothetical protein JHK86_025738 [Glycine max]KAG5134424.1 hypothetical protein JHK82_025612 [Glycine max]